MLQRRCIAVFVCQLIGPDVEIMSTTTAAAAATNNIPTASPTAAPNAATADATTAAAIAPSASTGTVRTDTATASRDATVPSAVAAELLTLLPRREVPFELRGQLAGDLAFASCQVHGGMGLENFELCAAGATQDAYDPFKALRPQIGSQLSPQNHVAFVTEQMLVYDHQIDGALLARWNGPHVHTAATERHVDHAQQLSTRRAQRDTHVGAQLLEDHLNQYPAHRIIIDAHAYKRLMTSATLGLHSRFILDFFASTRSLRRGETIQCSRFRERRLRCVNDRRLDRRLVAAGCGACAGSFQCSKSGSEHRFQIIILRLTEHFLGRVLAGTLPKALGAKRLARPR